MPTAREKAKDPAARLLIEAAEVPYLLSRPFVAPPDVPADRAKALQAAFMATARDADFLADAKKLNIDVSPVGAEDAMRMLDMLAAAPQDVKDKLKELFSAELVRLNSRTGEETMLRLFVLALAGIILQASHGARAQADPVAQF